MGERWFIRPITELGFIAKSEVERGIRVIDENVSDDGGVERDRTLLDVVMGMIYEREGKLGERRRFIAIRGRREEDPILRTAERVEVEEEAKAFIVLQCWRDAILLLLLFGQDL